jgi:2-amino-4-hydroxy-6-hydroxymethyldihydropteridine diphosphokinase
MTRALIGMGSNLGDRRAILDLAVAALRDLPGTRLVGVSRYHATEPVGGPGGQGAYLNAAATVETGLDPWALHVRLEAVEQAAGRERRVRWGERTLDLDLLFFGDRRIRAGEEPAGCRPLVVPHPRAVVRRFVLGPLAEIAPEFVDPRTGSTVRELLDHLDRRPSVLGLVAASEDAEERLWVAQVRERLGIGPAPWEVRELSDLDPVNPACVSCTLVARVPGADTPACDRGSVVSREGDPRAHTIVYGLEHGVGDSLGVRVSEVLALCDGTRGG